MNAPEERSGKFDEAGSFDQLATAPEAKRRCQLNANASGFTRGRRLPARKSDHGWSEDTDEWVDGLAILGLALLILKRRGAVLFLIGDHVADDPGQFVRCGRHRLYASDAPG